MTRFGKDCQDNHMRTLNVNLTPEQARLVDESAKRFGFANRSEFLRAILRYIFFYSPSILVGLDRVPFEQPPNKNPEYFIAELKKTNKYNKAFIASVGRGFKKAKYFKN